MHLDLSAATTYHLYSTQHYYRALEDDNFWCAAHLLRMAYEADHFQGLKPELELTVTLFYLTRPFLFILDRLAHSRYSPILRFIRLPRLSLEPLYIPG